MLVAQSNIISIKLPTFTWPEVLIYLTSEVDTVTCESGRNTIILAPFYLSQRWNPDIFQSQKINQWKSFLTYEDCKTNKYLRKGNHYSFQSKLFVCKCYLKSCFGWKMFKNKVKRTEPLSVEMREKQSLLRKMIREIG